MEKFKKITEKLYEDLLYKDEPINNHLVDKVKTHLIALEYDYQLKLEESLIDCESPIEQFLSMYLNEIDIKNCFRFNPFIDIVEIEKQKEIKYKNIKYRVDFLIPVIYKNQENKCFIIECDGYEFHQKTKEQVEKDNIRMRNLQELGYEVIRFSGTEVWNRPDKCVKDVLNIILSKCKYINERGV